MNVVDGENQHQQQQQQQHFQDFMSPSMSPQRRPSSNVAGVGQMLLTSPPHQQLHELRRALEDERIKRVDAERSLEIISERLSRLTSILANSEMESQEFKLRAETSAERLRLTEAELANLKTDLSETTKRAERFEDLAKKFEGEFLLRDKEYNQVLRERDLILRTSDEAISAVEDQHRAIKNLTQTQEALRRSSRKLLTLCDIAVSVGSEPPAMSSLRKFLRELLMDCATLKKYGSTMNSQNANHQNNSLAIPATAMERINSIYDRTSLIQDNLFSPSNPSMVVLDKSEALEIMTKLREALEKAG